MWNIDDMALPARKAIRVWAGDVEVMVKQVEKGKHYAISEAPETAKVVRLIAAAPCLLKTLEDTLANLEDFLDEDGEFEWTDASGRSVCRDIEKAIAKSKGGA